MKKNYLCLILFSLLMQKGQTMESPINHKPRTDVTDIIPELKTQKVGQEIEFKIKLSDVQQATLLTWLDTHAQKDKEASLKDIYYDKKDDSFFFVPQGKDYVDALRFVRIRYSGPKIVVTTKLRHMDELGNIQSCDEFEKKMTQEDIKAFQKSLEENGYVEKVIVEKKRTTYNVRLFNIDFEVAIDQVKGTDGIFVEIEIKTPDISTEVGNNLLNNFLKELGITQFVFYKRGYVVMLTNPNHNFAENVTLPGVAS